MMVGKMVGLKVVLMGTWRVELLGTVSVVEKAVMMAWKTVYLQVEQMGAVLVDA